MQHINIAIENMNNSTITKDEENLSIIERIMIKTGNPKIAAVLALDLFLVGVDTVSLWIFTNLQPHMNIHKKFHIDRVDVHCALCTVVCVCNGCTDKFYFHIFLS